MKRYMFWQFVLHVCERRESGRIIFLIFFWAFINVQKTNGPRGAGAINNLDMFDHNIFDMFDLSGYNFQYHRLLYSNIVYTSNLYNQFHTMHLPHNDQEMDNIDLQQFHAQTHSNQQTLVRDNLERPWHMRVVPSAWLMQPASLAEVVFGHSLAWYLDVRGQLRGRAV